MAADPATPSREALARLINPYNRFGPSPRIAYLRWDWTSVTG